MNLERVEAIVNAVLYEGYILYPYRPSAIKNRQRWTFGGLFPRAYVEAGYGGDPYDMQTQCLIRGTADTMLDVRIRFLHLLARQVGELSAPLLEVRQDWEPDYRPVASLMVNGQPYYTWQEAEEREITLPQMPVAALLGAARTTDFSLPANRGLELLREADGAITGVLIRSQLPVAGCITLAAESVADGAYRVTARIENHSPLDKAADISREQAQLQATTSTHTILGVTNGAFLSLLDPPEELCKAAAGCDNRGTYPVLVGEEGEHDTMLSSPIILYDYPQTAPESPGDLFDGTEIDEILTLRILAMTDEEKREMAAADSRARKLLERTEDLGAEQLQKLHGALRQLRPVTSDEPANDGLRNPFDAWEVKPQLAFLRVEGRELKVGDKVRLRPGGGADIMDLALDGKIAVIEAIERDFEDKVHVAVAVDDDPGRDFGLERMPGHRFFFSPQEIEPVEAEAARPVRPESRA